MPTGKTTEVTKISSSSRTITQTVSSSEGRIGLQQSFEEISSPSRQLFLENASLRMSPGWVSGHGSLFESPKFSGSPSPIKAPKTRRSSVYVKKSSVVASSVDSFKKPAVFISPTGVKTRARRSSIYQKSGKNLLTGLDSKARRDSLAAVRSKKLVSESDYVFTVPTADSAKRKKLVSKSSRAKKAVEPKISPKKASSKSRAKSKSPVKKSVKEINLVDSKPSKKSTQQSIKVISVKKKSSPKKEKTIRSKAKAKTPVKEVELAADDDDDDDDNETVENDILSPRRTRKTPGKSRKRSLSTVTKSAKKRKRSPSRSPSSAKKKKSPSPQKSPSPKKKDTPKKSSSKTKTSSSSKKKRVTKDSPNTSARKNSLEVSLTPLEIDESFTLKLNDSDRKKLTKSKTPSKSTPQKSSKSATKKTPKSSAKKSSTKKTPSSTKRISSSAKTQLTKSSEKKSNRKSVVKTSDEVAKVLELELTESFDSQNDIEVEDDISLTTIKTSPKSKTPLTSQKMKNILDSVSVQNGTDKKRKTTDFVEPQSANKRRRFDIDKFEKIVASTPRDMRLDILSGRRPELSPIPSTVNKNINNSFSMSKQVTIFSDKSTFLSAGPSNLSPVASKSPMIVSEMAENQVYQDLVDGNDYEDDFEYSHISVSQKPSDPEPYLYDYDCDLDTSHSNVQAGCTIL